jgi:hypothetical protein
VRHDGLKVVIFLSPSFTKTSVVQLATPVATMFFASAKEIIVGLFFEASVFKTFGLTALTLVFAFCFSLLFVAGFPMFRG